MNGLRITASELYSYYRPSKCELRVYLRHREEPEDEPSAYELLIRKLGQRHEQRHLSTLPSVVDLSNKQLNKRFELTRECVQNGTQAIYQAALTANINCDGTDCEVVGEPDFLINESGRYVIRDSKISRRITEKDHPEIILQLQLYGWLFHQTFSETPLRLEVHAGDGRIVPIEMDTERVIQEVARLAQMELAAIEPYSPVGWTKCGSCGFHSRCWPAAERARDVALLAGVDQGLALALRNNGVETVEDLLQRFDENRLASFSRPWGKKTRRVGKDAGPILIMAKSMLTGQEILLGGPDLPGSPNHVMFDLEGLPPHLDEIEKVYLWGLQVFGEKPSQFIAATGGFGADGDKECWQSFLSNARQIFDEYGDLPFVHWHHYERVRINMYLDRYGDSSGTAERVKKNMLDLLPVAQRSIALPLPSYSLKVVEKYIGFRRTQDEYGGDWAMAKYIEATETHDEKLRAEVMEQILTYNREDLEATWAVFQWLKSKSNH